MPSEPVIIKNCDPLLEGVPELAIANEPIRYEPCGAYEPLN